MTSTISTYSQMFKLKNGDEIKSLHLRLGDEDDTVFVMANCESIGTLVTPVNVIKFVRTVASHKFNILFNRNYFMEVISEQDQERNPFIQDCNANMVVEGGQKDLEIEVLAKSLNKYTEHLNKLMGPSGEGAEVAGEIFLKTFLSRDVAHKSSNLYRTTNLIRSLTTSFPSIFQPILRGVLEKIFWTMGKGHNYVRMKKQNYFKNVNIKNNLLNALFSDSPRVFLESLRNVSSIGERFRKTFMNSSISINQLMSNDTELVSTLLNILFVRPLSSDELKLMNPHHIIKRWFVYYYLKDLNVNKVKLNNIHKRFIYNANKKDYATIGRFIRYIFFQSSGMAVAEQFIESDVLIGMRVVFLLASGRINENEDIYTTVKNIITKKDAEIPEVLEYPAQVITKTLNKCYVNPRIARSLFMLTMEDIMIDNFHNVGRLFDPKQGQFLYEFYKNMILNDIQKEKSIMKESFLEAAPYIREFIGSLIQSVVANADKNPKVAQIAINFVKDTIAFANLNVSDRLTSNQDLVKVFKKIIELSSKETSKKQEIINFKLALLGQNFSNSDSNLRLIKRISNNTSVKFDASVYIKIDSLIVKHGSLNGSAVEKLNDFLKEKPKKGSQFDKLVKQDLERGIIFEDDDSASESRTLYLYLDSNSAVMERERLAKIIELEILECWFEDESQSSEENSSSPESDKWTTPQNEPLNESITTPATTSMNGMADSVTEPVASAVRQRISEPNTQKIKNEKSGKTENELTTETEHELTTETENESITEEDSEQTVASPSSLSDDALLSKLEPSSQQSAQCSCAGKNIVQSPVDDHCSKVIKSLDICLKVVRNKKRNKPNSKKGSPEH
ncbi:hypothetical protein HHI36_001449 [Cryptolaemus montrouzieri]|uniref:Uncharacterized protein n=1 Tax=Cryptolaemus montrouzieri TaxID=559131 RepID=A0ABD2P7P7_9CUCU